MMEISRVWRGRVEPAETEFVSGDRQRWTPTYFIRGTLALHLLALLLVGLRPELWPWIVGCLAANHLAIAAIVPFPRNALVGANLTRLPQEAAARGEVALTFDDGPDPAVTPHVLDLLDLHDMRATFFCIARNALAHPDLVREIVKRGHHVENHSHRHSVRFSLHGYARLSREIDLAQVTLTRIANRAPRFFRAPAGIRSPWLDPILQRRGLRHIAWTRRGFDAVERNPQRVLSRLTQNLAGGDVLLLHDGGAARTRDGKPVVLEVLPALLGDLRQRGLTSVTLSDGFFAKLSGA